MSYAMEVGLKPVRAADNDLSFHRAAFDVGATGALTAISGNTPVIALTRTGVGIYTVVLPKAVLGFPPILNPVTDTAVAWKVTAFSATSGTATIEFMDEAGAAVELADGDELHIMTVAISTKRV